MNKHLLILLLSSSPVLGEVNLFIPLTAIHAKSYYSEYSFPPGQITANNPLIETRHAYNTETFGLGIEYSAMNASYALSVNENSYFQTSVYAAIGYSAKGKITYTASAVAASGYGSSLVYFPMFSLKYKDFRLSTTYPFAALTCDENTKYCNDFINLQYVINIY